MEHLLEGIPLLENIPLLRGYIFGVVHAGLIIVGYYSGWSINRFLKIMSNGFVAGILGAIFAHVIADLVASLLDPSIRSATLGIVLGGLTPLIFIPFLEKYVVKSKHHIVVGDHDDVEKDLKNH
ncbi:MAG: hypothetical protein HVK41_02635 [Pelagibacteraceae bacterium]|jgi:hypothetical protein|nr:hypothetical protein [Pelagibacteraceae bacterium]MDP6783902.1 hypothetical protein [Alphaproteobacteria bacterium]MBO6467880.1 hypothetical protein [Pelagibacteraceae bacterium]MBO6469896.1 hypothetical protein [Pelagibacteraceae bacterium]MBO6479870.1 hypothetical protein [Pelagibacteraceae bacterium]|tara:strand:- start:1422 stop:1793 length:372 start_codon:yes stop_codon:yes gene_type:complete